MDLELRCAGSSPSLVFTPCKTGFLPRTATRSWPQVAVTVCELQRVVSLRWSMFSITCLHLLGAGGVTFGDRCSLVATSPLGKCNIPLLDFYKVPSCHKEL